ncbi:MAG TPA: pitrilysin family protein [Candidatus Paceibacterota bacterium]|nr:pitrilysin family protein [Candidatus Paceibacterota bacterium]
MVNYQVHKFSNGLRLLMVPSKEVHSFKCSVMVKTGSDYENKRNNGISHFLEHMCFKGTKKRPSNLVISQELDEVGGSYNAFTSREVTGYWTKVSDYHFKKAIDITSDIFLNSVFRESDVEKEKRVIQEEINMYLDDPKEKVWDNFFELLYKNQPAGWPIAGSKENVSKFRAGDLFSYRSSQYRAKSVVLVVSGNFKAKEIISLVKDYFRKIPGGKAKEKIKTKEKQIKPQLSLEYKKTDQTHLRLGVRGINLFDPRRYALHVLDTILGGGMSFRLWQLVREKLGAAYYVSSFVESATDRGIWGITAGIDNDRINLIISKILKEWKELKQDLITPKEIKKAKENIRGKILLATEDIHQVANYYAFDLLYKNKIETFEHYLTNILKVKPLDLNKLANDLLKPSNLNLAVIGPFKNKSRFLQILKI